MPGPRLRRTPSPSLAHSSCAPAHAERGRRNPENGGGGPTAHGDTGGDVGDESACQRRDLVQAEGCGEPDHREAPSHDAGTDIGGTTRTGAQTLLLTQATEDPDRGGLRRTPAVAAPAATYMTAAVSAVLRPQEEGAAAGGAAETWTPGWKWPLPALAPRTT